MGFWGKTAIFDGVPFEDFSLMMYDFNGKSSGDESDFASSVTVVDEVVGSRWKPFFYGVKYEKKLEFDIVFGVNQHRIDNNRFLDRYEISEIASWLTGHDEYKILEIEQDDMTFARYKCMITNLTQESYGSVPWAMVATVTCDSPYAYMYPQTFEYEVDGSTELVFYNESCINGYFYPQLSIEIESGNSFEIINNTDKGSSIKFTNLPASIHKINVNNDTCVITNDQDINLYDRFNNSFLRLKKGYNNLKVNGTGKVVLTCEFPVNIGG